MNRFLLLIPPIALFACQPRASASPPDGPSLKIVSYCDLHECQPMDDAPGPDFIEVTWCCDNETGDCVAVASLLACDPEMEYGVICEWGQSVPQSSQTGEVDCFD